MGREPRAGARLEEGDAGVADVDQRHDRGVAVHRRDQQPARPVGEGDADLAAGDRAVGVRRRGRAADRPAGLAERGGEQHLAARRRRAAAPASARRCRPPASDQGAAAERLPDRQVRRAGAGLAEQHADLGQPEPLAAVRLGDGEPEQPGLGELGPAAVAVEHVGQHRADRRRATPPLLGRSGSTCVKPSVATCKTVTCSSRRAWNGGRVLNPLSALRRHGLPAVRADPRRPDGRAAGPRVDVRHRHARGRHRSPPRSCCSTRWAAPGC